MATINRPRKKRENKPKEDKTKLIYDTVYNTSRWRAIRKAQLMIHPLCERCMRNLSEEVHHIKPISTASDPLEMMELGFDTGNLICLCKECHTLTHRELREGGKKDGDNKEG